METVNTKRNVNLPELRSHQRQCLDKTNDYLTSNDEGLIEMFCGTGKSLVEYKLLLNFETSVIIFPSIGLITQFNRDYIIKYDYPYSSLSICSKDELNESNLSDKECVTRLNLKVTTDESHIIKFIETNESYLILCTFQSLETLSQILNKKCIMVNLIIYDEAHHIVGDNTQSLIFGSLKGCSHKRLFFTATPKNDNGIYMTSENNHSSNCGDCIFKYTHRQAVEDDNCRDFDVCVNLSHRGKEENIYECIARNALATDNYRILVFHATVEESKVESYKKKTNVKGFSSEENKKKFEKIFRYIRDREYPEKKYIDKIKFESITKETISSERLNILKNFDECKDDEVFIISSCRTIGEGIDTKRCNHICWADPKKSFVDIIQNIGRGARKKMGDKNDTKKFTISIPVLIDKKKYEDSDNMETRDAVIREEMINEDNWEGILNVLSALRQNDPDYYDLCLNYPHKFCRKEIEKNLNEQGYKIKKRDDIVINEGKQEMEDSQESSNDRIEVLSQIEKYANDKDLTVELHTNSMEEPVKMIGENKEEEEKLYFDDETGEVFEISKKDKNDKREKKILPPRRKRFNMKVHMDNELRVLWNIRDGYDLTKEITSVYLDCQVVDNEEKWMENYQKLKNNQKLSYWRTKLGAWENTQRLKFNSKTLKQNKIVLLNQLEFWKWSLNRADEIFEEKRSRYEIFYLEKQRIPSQSSLFPEEKMLAGWRSDWIKIFNGFSKVKRNEERINQLNNTIGWYWDIWYYNFDKYCEYINENKKRPPSEHRLGAWENTQRLAYHKKVKSDLDDDKISKLESIPGWKWKLETKEDKWLIQYNRSKLFTIENQRLAQIIKTPKEKNEIYENKIADWNNAQRRKKRNNDADKSQLSINQKYRGTLSEGQIKLLEEIPGWYWDKSEKSLPSPIKTNSPENSQKKSSQSTNQSFICDTSKSPKKIRCECGQEFSRKSDLTRHIKTKKHLEYIELKSKYDNEQNNNTVIDSIKKKFPNSDIIKNSDKDLNESTQSSSSFLSSKDDSVDSTNESLSSQSISIDSISTPSSPQPSQTPPLKPSQKPAPQPPQTPRSYLLPIPNSKEEKSTTHSFSSSKLSKFHKYFKTLHSSNYFSYIQSNPNEFKEYYQLSKQAEKNDDPEDKPLHIIADQLNQLAPKQKVVDLGCGDATLSTLCPQHLFTNIDAYSLNDKVEVYDITKLPENFSNSFDVVVLSRAMWSTNKKDVLNEAKRILKPNGKLFICEPFKRWNWNKEQKKFGENKLSKLLNQNGFVIQGEHNTELQDGMYPKFMYYKCIKKEMWTKSKQIVKEIYDLFSESEMEIEKMCKSK
jgi:superfamily II DNA or RNA helicase/SAM-dependent methyltransferase